MDRKWWDSNSFHFNSSVFSQETAGGSNLLSQLEAMERWEEDPAA
jgi:hypothetical protein